MREVLFRGKRTNGGWVFGSPLPHDNSDCTMFWQDPGTGLLESAEVDPETVGQYTGLTDKNGAMIWEGDLLRYSYDYPGSPWLAQKGMTDDDIRYDVGAVFWQDWRGSWAVCGKGKCMGTNNDVFKYCRNPNRTEVIGNIFDNPELIEQIGGDGDE